MEVQTPEYLLWHISDIHIANGFHEDILFAIKQLITKIKEETVVPLSRQLLVMAGDIFDNKTRVGQYDLQCFHTMMELLSFIKILVIPGNHDYAPNSTNNLDLVSAALKNQKYDHVYIYPYSGVYHIPGFPTLNFHILSPIDNIIPPIDPQASNDAQASNKNIAIIHEPIRGCKLYGSTTVKNARLDREMLEVYDAALAGDIHKYQYLNERRSIAYCGSLVQRNKLEDLIHGCIKWAVYDDKILPQFARLKMRSAIIRLLIKDNQVEFPEHKWFEKVREVILGYKECTPQAFDKIRKEVEQRYGHINSVEDLSLKSKKSSATNSENQGSESQQDSQESTGGGELWDIANQISMLEEALFDHPHKQEIVELHVQLTNKHADQMQRAKYKWQLDYLYWSNLFCFGENNFVDFASLHSINALIGKNRTGKSSIIDILLFILYNDLERGTHKSIVNNNAKKYKVICGFTIIKDISRTILDRYIIMREGDNNAGGQISTLRLLRKTHNTESWVNITEADIPSTYRLLRSLVGEKEDLIGVNVALQNHRLLPDLKTNEQLEQFRKYFGLDRLEEIEEEVRKEKNKMKAAVKALEAAIEKPTSKHSEDELQKALADKEKILAKLEKLLQTAVQKKDELNRELFPLKFPLEKIEEELQAAISVQKSQTANFEQNSQADIPENITFSEEELIRLQQEKEENEEKITQAYKNYSKIEETVEELEAALRAITPLIDEVEVQKQLLICHAKQKKLVSQLSYSRYLARDFSSLTPEDTQESVSQALTEAKAAYQANEEKLEAHLRSYVEPAGTLTDLQEQLRKLPSIAADNPASFQAKILANERQLTKLQAALKPTTYAIGDLAILKIADTPAALQKDLDHITAQLQALNEEKAQLRPTPNLQRKTTLTKEQLQGIIIRESLEELYASLPLLDSRFKPDPPVAKPQHPKAKLVTRKQELEIALALSNKDLQQAFEFAEDCPCCEKNRSTLTTKAGDPKDLNARLTRVLAFLTQWEEYEVYATNWPLYQKHRDIQHKIDILHDQQFYAQERLMEIEEEVASLQARFAAQTNKLNVAREKSDILANEMTTSQIQKLQKENEALATALIQSKERAHLQTLIQAHEQAVQWKQTLTSIREQKTQLQQEIAILAEKLELVQNYQTFQQREKEEQEIARLSGKIAKFTKQLQDTTEYRRISSRLSVQRDNLKIQEQTNQWQQRNRYINAVLKWYPLRQHALKNIALRAQLETIEKEITDYEEKRKRTQKNREIILLELQKHQKYTRDATQLEQQQKQVVIYSTYLDLINKKSGLPYQLLQRSIREVQNAMNQILETITDFRVKLETDEKNFSILTSALSKTGMINYIPASQASGFQKFIIDLSMRLCLAANHPYLPSFFIVDEGFGCLDAEHLSNTREFLHNLQLQGRFEWLIVISHIEDLQYISNRQLQIERVHGLSHLLHGTPPEWPNPSNLADESQGEIEVMEDQEDAPGIKRWYCLACKKSVKFTEIAKTKHLATEGHAKKMGHFNPARLLSMKENKKIQETTDKMEIESKENESTKKEEMVDDLD